MATALQQQLAQIAQKSTNQLDLKAQRVQHSKSLIFDARTAANQTFETIYQISVEAFQELCMLDPRFVPFANNLFSEQSKSEERINLTTQQNQELDVIIQSFLGLVGARLLLRPGIKAVEWLVRRFRVHEYNTECLVLTFLPYHATPIFPNMLSILPKTLPPTLRFLQPYIASLSSPPRHAILYAAINNPGFFTAFNTYVIRTCTQGHHSASSLGFWASITAQAINGLLDTAQSGRADVRNQRQEDLLLRLVPMLQQTLRIKNAPELFLGSCMIITILVAKAQLDDKLLDALMDAVVRGWSPQTLDDALTCVAVIAEERQSLKLPRNVTRALLKPGQLPARLSVLSTKQHTGRLTAGLAITSLDELSSQSSTDVFDLVEYAIDSQALTLAQKSAVVSVLMSMSSNLPALPEPTTSQDRLARIFSTLCQSPATLPLVQNEAARTNLSIESLEIQLQISLVPSQPLALTADADIEMTDDAADDQADSLDQVLAALPGDLTRDHSFLSTDEVAPFDAFARASLLFLQKNKNFDELLTNPALHSAEALTSPTFLSFLARLWTGTYPTVARVSALRAASSKLRAHSSEAVDMQALIPYALVALADASEGVRKAAADLLIAISELYHATAVKGKISDSIKPWATQTIYGQKSKKDSSLTSQNAYKFLSEALVPSLEECILDNSQISRLLINALNGPAQAHPGHPTPPSVELKSAVRTALFTWLCEHATLAPLVNVRVQILTFLAHAGKVGSTGRVQVLIPSLQNWVSSDVQKCSASCAAAHVDVATVDRAYIGCLTSRTSEELICLKSLSNGELGQEATLATIAIHRLKSLWPTMKPLAQTSAAGFLLDLALDDKTDDAAQIRQSEATDLLRQVHLPTEVLASILDSVPSIAQMEEKPPAAKRRRTSRSELAKAQSISVADLHVVIRKLTLVLELIEGSQPEKHPELLKSLFHVLSELQHYRTHLGTNLVYLQQLVISCLLSIVESLKQNPSAKVDRSVLRADLIVECVRTSTNAQIHNAALLLISSLASWAPDLVLHSVMPIFTFMSNTLLRQNDDYSAHIIDQTVSRVVPPLVASLRKKNQDVVTGAAELLLSFTAAFEHIPLHRRSRLFSHLVTALGPQDFLPAIMAMLFEKHPTDKRVPVFSAELMGSFSPIVQLVAASKYIDLTMDTLRPKSTVSEAIFSFNDKTPQQIEQSVEHLLRSLAQLLQQRSLHVQILKALDKDEDSTGRLQSAAAEILQKIMLFSTSKTLDGKSNLQSACGEVLTAALSLLPTPYFIRTAEELLQRPEQDLRLMALRSLEQRGRDARMTDMTAANAMLAVLPSVTSIISQGSPMELAHSAVTCVDVISEKFGKKDTEKVLSAANVIASDNAYGSDNDELRIISLLCLATMVEVLRDDLVPLLPQILKTASQYFYYATKPETGNTRLHDAVYAFLSAIIEYVPWMFSASTLDDALLFIQTSASSEASGIRLLDSREQFSILLSKQVDARTMLSAIDRKFDSAISSGYSACKEVLSLLHRVITTHPKSTLIKNASVLFSTLNKSFDLRRLLISPPHSATSEQVAAIDAQRDALALDAILRLNDATFRPFFVRISDVDAVMKGVEPSAIIYRQTSLYGFTAKFFEGLKSIVTGYSSYLLDQTARILKEVIPDEENEQLLIKNVLRTLIASFSHDQDDFWQIPAHFEAVAGPLLEQLVLARSPAVRDTLDIVSAVTALGGAAASPDHHKSLNSSLLKLMRHDDALVRLSAVKCEQSLTNRLGEDWLALLPEMLPFISELQEDDDEDVERETTSWIRQIEGILGESLEGMLQ